jgi:hypothetical protein
LTVTIVTAGSMTDEGRCIGIGGKHLGQQLFSLRRRHLPQHGFRLPHLQLGLRKRIGHVKSGGRNFHYVVSW